MSSTSDTSDQEKYKRATICNVFASTPLDKAPTRRYTTSLSRIDTNSSLSEGKIEGSLQSQIAKKGGGKKRKKAVKNKTKQYKKRVIQLNDIKRVTSTEWDTESEESIEEAVTNPEDSIRNESDDACINLFDDPCTPEKIRQAPITYESPLYHSPIIRSSRRFKLTPKRNIIAQHDELLPVNIPSSEVWNPEETDRDEVILVNRTNNVKTYCPKDSVKKKSQSSLKIYWSAIYPPGYFSMSDLLWEEFVKKNREEISQYLAPSSSARVPVKKYDSEFLRKFPDISPKFEGLPVLPGMTCIRGYSDRISQKWVTYIDKPSKSENKKDNARQTKARKRSKRKQRERAIMLQSARNETNSVFDTEDEIDVEFETGGRDGNRMSFSEFRQKRKRIVETVSEKSSSESCHSQMQKN
ncbi:uncharacterized protein LOC126857449 [Cataglyphis hispanica]|uniref:uncharacterized protein LOC126857449 n=1 Tax=Cataglyphis hispanica TaxID=1086592 RepID=UPI00217FE3E9|nr:uncharacterized protein LOC126857449 [Cataglyphis hispanica]